MAMYKRTKWGNTTITTGNKGISLSTSTGSKGDRLTLTTKPSGKTFATRTTSIGGWTWRERLPSKRFRGVQSSTGHAQNRWAWLALSILAVFKRSAPTSQNSSPPPQYGSSLPEDNLPTFAKAMPPLSQKIQVEDIISAGCELSNLEASLSAGRSGGQVLGHVLIIGADTDRSLTLARVIARDLGSICRTVSASALVEAGEFAAVLTNLDERDSLFIANIDQLNPSIEKILYPAMRDFELDLIIGENEEARAVKIDLAKYTLVASAPSEDVLRPRLIQEFKFLIHLSA
jgi:Holliday junction DNA helicase RuvB P-loop domain